MAKHTNLQKQPTQETHPLYHSTKKLLMNYRDVVWHIEVSSEDLQTEVRTEYGHALDDCLEILQAVGATVQGAKLEGYALALERSRKMLQIIDNAVSIMRRRHKHGELYYWVLYYSYLSPQQYKTIDEILSALDEHNISMSMRTYYTRREEAIQTLSSLLWGFTRKDCQKILENFDV